MGFKKASEWGTPTLVAAMQKGTTVKTEVWDPEASKAAGPVYLTEGDEVCSGCDTLITPDEYPGADWANLLARLKLQYGHTVCAECHGALPDA